MRPIELNSAKLWLAANKKLNGRMQRQLHVDEMRIGSRQHKSSLACFILSVDDSNEELRACVRACVRLGPYLSYGAKSLFVRSGDPCLAKRR